MPHSPFLYRCLALADQGRGYVGNGALVGAVLVRDGVIIAEGYHAAFGHVHAERDLLQRYTDEILPHDILYVNLEPCCPSPTKKTPPCTDIIFERGIRNVVYGMHDPDVRVAGKGIEILQSHGVIVMGPVESVLCERLNRGFVSVRTQGRPYITLKKAMMPDGRISNVDGSSLKITSDEQNAWSHTWLRSTHDAILVGVGTVIADDPRLDIRLASPTPSPSPPSTGSGQAGRGERQFNPWRIVLDRTLRIQPDARVVTDDNRHRTIIVHGAIVDHDMNMTYDYLREQGVRLIEIPIIDDAFDWNALWQALITPDHDYHGLTSILVEGGTKTWEMCKQAGMMDEEIILMGH